MLSYASTVNIDAHQYDFTTTGKTLDLLPIVACSPLVTPATNYSVTVTPPPATGIEKYSFITNQTSIKLNGSFPQDERFSVSLQILEGEPGIICCCIYVQFEHVVIVVVLKDT